MTSEPTATRSGLRLLALVTESVAAAVVATAVSLAIQFVVGRLTIPRPSSVPVALTALAVTALMVVLVSTVWLPWTRARTIVGWAVPASVSTTALAFLLAGSRFYLNGVNDDQINRLQFLERLADTSTLADGNYIGLPPFYPAGWFWVGGRFATALGWPGWAAYKPYAILTMGVASALAFVLWSRSVGRRRALVLATVTSAVGYIVDAYEPYSWLVAALLPPMVVLVHRLLTTTLARPGCRPLLAGGGLVGVALGLMASVYTLLAGFSAFVTVVLVVVVLAMSPQARRVQVWRGGAGLTTAAVVAAVVALPWWGPFLIEATRQPNAGNFAAKYLPALGATTPAPFLEPTALGVVSATGVVWLVLRTRSNPVALALAVLALSCYFWQYLSTLLLARHTTLLTFTTGWVLQLTLACAGALGSMELLSELSERGRGHAAALRIGSAVVATVLVVQWTQSPAEVVAQRLPGAFSSFDDTAHSADGGTPRSDDPGSWNADLFATVDALSRHAPRDVVVLTSYWPILALRPFHGVNTIVQEYANPLALYPERRQQVERWASAPDARGLLSDLGSSPFPPPGILVLERRPDGLHLTVSVNQFPRTNAFHDVVFPTRLFDDPGFVRRDVGPFTVIARTDPSDAPGAPAARSGGS